MADPAETDATPIAQPAAPAPARSAQIVDVWFRERICNSVAAHHTDGLNHFAIELEELKRRLAEEN